MIFTEDQIYQQEYELTSKRLTEISKILDARKLKMIKLGASVLSSNIFDKIGPEWFWGVTR